MKCSQSAPPTRVTVPIPALIFTLSATLAVTYFAAGTRPAQGAPAAPQVSGELRVWHRVTLTFTGPRSSEGATPNPFRDYRLQVVFTHGEREIVVPGYFAADGSAGQTGAVEGDRWRVHFMPDQPGVWQYHASFRTGPDVAINPSATSGQPTAFDGVAGGFTVAPSDKHGRDFRGHGLLAYAGKRYLRFAGSGEYYLKGGANSPENFLGYSGFDGTVARRGSVLHHYQPHVADWRPGDPLWTGDRGKGIIGALNYLASRGMNSVYFLTMNVEGDAGDVWPWVSDRIRDRFDCSKLDQWETVFEHMTRQGLAMHVVIQENENDQLLDGGELGPLRRLYHRELIARFAHHPALIWNLGEENTNTAAQLHAFAQHFRQTDPYDHPVVIHTFPNQQDRVYGPMLGMPYMEGVSLQLGAMHQTHAETLKWIDRAARAGRPWFVCLDEIGQARNGVYPDSVDAEHNDVRCYALWGNLLTGGAGCEWYFGYAYKDNDLNCENWRSRERMWDQTRIALEFVRRHLPFTEMQPAPLLTNFRDDYVLAVPGQTYAVYLPPSRTTNLDLQGSTSSFTVRWFNPRTGGPLERGSVHTIQGPGQKSLGTPPRDPRRDWVVLVTRNG